MTERAEFRIVGEAKIHCGGCEQRINVALRKIGGVSAVHASAETQEIVVDFDPEKSSRGDMQQRLEEMGYDVESSR